MAKGRFKSPGLKALHDRYIGDDPEKIASFEHAVADASIAQSIYDLRTKAGLSQKDLAARVGTTGSVICRWRTRTTRGIRWPCSAGSPPPSASASRSYFSPWITRVRRPRSLSGPSQSEPKDKCRRLGRDPANPLARGHGPVHGGPPPLPSTGATGEIPMVHGGPGR